MATSKSDLLGFFVSGEVTRDRGKMQIALGSLVKIPPSQELHLIHWPFFEARAREALAIYFSMPIHRLKCAGKRMSVNEVAITQFVWKVKGNSILMYSSLDWSKNFQNISVEDLSDNFGVLSFIVLQYTVKSITKSEMFLFHHYLNILEFSVCSQGKLLIHGKSIFAEHILGPSIL